MSKLLHGWLLALCCYLAGTGSARAQKVLINEIFYRSPEANTNEQWIELFNNDNTPINLKGWRFSQGINFFFENTTVLGPGGYLIIAANQQVFQDLHPEVANFLAPWKGSLNWDGEELRLEDGQGRLVDAVTYANQGDWAVRRLGAVDILNRQGWEWFAEHDGLGKSLELINPRISNDFGQNWSSSLAPGGTPGRANSIQSFASAPLILDVTHIPAVPKSTDSVAIITRLLDEIGIGIEASLFWRVDGSANFLETPMRDDGQHQDGLANDGIFGAILEAKPDRTIVEFFISSRGRLGQTRIYPMTAPSGNDRTASLLYQVDDSTYTGNQPVLRLIMSQAEYSYLSNQIWQGQPRSDAMVNGTFINMDGVLEGGSSDQVRYNCGFRNRGHGSRYTVPHNFHVAFPGDRPWKGRPGLNLNTHYTHSQQLGSAIFRRLGIPLPESRPVQVRVNGINLAKPGQEQFGSYAANEVLDDRFVETQFPLDPEGNLYRGVRDMAPGVYASADLVWRGPIFASYTNAYTKENHSTLNDWSDFVQLIDVLNNTPESDYAQAVSRVLHVEEWMKYFAVNTLLDNQETILGTGAGDDFGLYRGTRDTRFQLLPYDMDSLMGQGRRTNTYADGIWRMTALPVINQFMKCPEFVPFYFKYLKHLAETAFSPEQMDPFLDHLLSSYVDLVAIANMKAFNSNHVAYVLTQIPQSLTVVHRLPEVHGYFYTTNATIALHGNGNAIETRSVLVNGLPSAWSAWQGFWANQNVSLKPGLNRVLIQAFGADHREIERVNLDLWHDNGYVQTIHGNVASNTTWTADGGPYLVTNNLQIDPGVTLIIEPGASVYFAPGANLTVANGGQLIAEGTPVAPIRFTSAPGTNDPWGGMIIQGEVGSPETQLAHVIFEHNGTTAIHSSSGSLSLDHLTFGATHVPYLLLESSSFVVSHCVFPNAAADFQLVRGTGGIKSGGRGIFQRNYFGASQGYNDTVDFTGGNRPGPIVHFINNVFMGSGDDLIDLDGTDAWVEGNILLHCHKNGAMDSSSAISGGQNSGRTSAITILRNLFYDCDHAVTAKQGNFFVLLNNTIVHQNIAGGLDTDGAVVNLADEGTTEGAGVYLEGNIILDAEKLVRNLTNASVIFNNNLMPLVWKGRGGGNSMADPMLRHLPALAETHFSSWEEAQAMRSWMQPLPGSPALSAGLNGANKGGVVPLGITVSGEPISISSLSSAILTVGQTHPEDSIPISGWPNGAGYTHYRWRLNQGPWSGDLPVGAPLVLSNLTNGSYRVEVSGQRDSGLYQDDPVFMEDALATQSRSWTVDLAHIPPPSQPSIRINEVQVRSSLDSMTPGGSPDLIELHNYGATPVDLSGMGLTDSSAQPFKFTFPAGTILSEGGYLILIADHLADASNRHTGFSLKSTGDHLYLYHRMAAGGGLIDSISFGLQIAEYSLGQRADSTWGLCQPTFGAANVAQATGDIHSLRINEWLARPLFSMAADFVEIYNRDSRPVALEGLYLSDAAGSPTRHAIAPLSFVAGKGLALFKADDNPSQGADHLSFKLSPEAGLILLSAPDMQTIDAVTYSSLPTDLSEGRSPNGSGKISSFLQPTPGGSNPGAAVDNCVVTLLTVPLLSAGSSWKFNQTDNLDPISWMAPDYDDSSWPSGPALLAAENCNCLPSPGIGTPLTLGRTTYYFRTRFVVDANLLDFELKVNMVVDDGAILYLNGSPWLTNGFSGSAHSYSDLASRDVGNASSDWFTLPANTLLHGTNTLAVEVHQHRQDSGDIVWGMALEAVKTITNCSPTSPFSVVINEIQVPISGSQPGFIELCNTGQVQADLSDQSLSDDSRFPRKWIFPPNSILPPGTCQVVGVNESGMIGGANVRFNLSLGGGAVYLFDQPAQGGSLLDGIRLGLQIPEYSLARIPHGFGAWQLAIPTPATTNVGVILGDVSALRINEWMADSANGSDWLEVYNGSPRPVSLAGLFLTDRLDLRTLSPIAPLSFIGTGAHAYSMFIADGNGVAGADHVIFSLKKEGETIGLFTARGQAIDSIAFGQQQEGVSQGRYPDGAPDLIAFPGSASPARGNYLFSNEDSDGDRLPDDWERANFNSLERDGYGDFDQDGMTDWQEFLAGTSPLAPSDLLKIVSISIGNSVTLEFHAAGGKSYTIQYNDSLEPGSWRKLADVQPSSLSSTLSFTDPNPPGSLRYYRIISPQQP